MDETTLQRVIRVIAVTQHYPAEKAASINGDTTFEQLGIDSLDGINIVFALENEFDVNIPDEAARNLRGIGEIAIGMDNLVAAKAGAPKAGMV